MLEDTIESACGDGKTTFGIFYQGVRSKCTASKPVAMQNVILLIGIGEKYQIKLSSCYDTLTVGMLGSRKISQPLHCIKRLVAIALTEDGG